MSKARRSIVISIQALEYPYLNLCLNQPTLMPEISRDILFRSVSRPTPSASRILIRVLRS